jgi:beta-phosphoglucomutase family hydrolase
MKAFLFDLNGTMIDDMHYHIIAWHRILNELGADISMDKMKEECYGKNHELLERTFPGRFSYAEKDRMSLEKEKQYQQEYRPKLQLINGLDNFLKDTYKQEILMAIGSAAIRFNIDFVLDGLNIRHYFNAVVSADDVNHSKPHPETWMKCAQQLNIDTKDCIVFEDSPKGVQAAETAGMQSVVVTTMHTPDEFKHFRNVICFAKDFSQVSPKLFLK